MTGLKNLGRIHPATAAPTTRAELRGGLGRPDRRRFPNAAAISLPSPAVTNPFVQGHKGNHKPLACQQLCLYLGRRGPARTTSCQFDGAPGARRDVRIHAGLSPRQKNVQPRLLERCLLPRCCGFHQMRFISRGLWEESRGRRSPTSSSLIWMCKRAAGYSCLTPEKQAFF